MVKSAKGQEVAFEALRAKNEKMVAIGNAKMNARGDLLGKNGQIVKTREEIALEYNTNVSNPAKNIPLSQDTISEKKGKEASIVKTDTTTVEVKKSKIEKTKNN